LKAAQPTRSAACIRRALVQTDHFQALYGIAGHFPRLLTALLIRAGSVAQCILDSIFFGAIYTICSLYRMLLHSSFFLHLFLTCLLPYLSFPLWIDPLCFQAGCHRRRPKNLALVFLCLFCVVVHFFLLVNVSFCCVRFSFFPNKAKDWLGETSPKWPILCRVGCKTTTQPINTALLPMLTDTQRGSSNWTCWGDRAGLSSAWLAATCSPSQRSSTRRRRNPTSCDTLAACDYERRC